MRGFAPIRVASRAEEWIETRSTDFSIELYASPPVLRRGLEQTKR
jgi:hypothetical protein